MQVMDRLVEQYLVSKLPRGDYAFYDAMVTKKAHELVRKLHIARRGASYGAGSDRLRGEPSHPGLSYENELHTNMCDIIWLIL